MGRIGSTKLALPKWHKYGTYNRHLRVETTNSAFYCQFGKNTKHSDQTEIVEIHLKIDSFCTIKHLFLSIHNACNVTSGQKWQ